MSFNVQQLQYGLAYKPQSALQTANLAADFWLLSKINAQFNKFSLTTETDAAEIGKRSEFAQAVYPVSWDISGSLEKILSSELSAFAFIFGLGTANAAYSNGTYTVTPMDACDGLDMPPFTVVEQIGSGCSGGAAVDRAAIGCVINDFSISFGNGPGRSNSKINVNFVGCGKNAQPSTILLPTTKLVEHELRGGSAAVTIQGVDYTSSKGLLSLEMAFRNNIRLDSGFFIGSGSQDGASIRGRMERGNRDYTFSFVTRLEQGSAEYTKLKTLATGPATITLTNSATESLEVVYHKVGFSAVDLAEDNGIATVQVNCAPEDDPTLGVLTATIKTAVAGIGGVV